MIPTFRRIVPVVLPRGDGPENVSASSPPCHPRRGTMPAERANDCLQSDRVSTTALCTTSFCISLHLPADRANRRARADLDLAADRHLQSAVEFRPDAAPPPGPPPGLPPEPEPGPASPVPWRRPSPRRCRRRCRRRSVHRWRRRPCRPCRRWCSLPRGSRWRDSATETRSCAHLTMTSSSSRAVASRSTPTSSVTQATRTRPRSPTTPSCSAARASNWEAGLDLFVYFWLAGDFALGPPASAAPVAPANLATTDDFVALAPWNNLAILQVGQFDAPFTLENRPSDKYFDFMERSITVRAFGVPTTKRSARCCTGSTTTGTTTTRWRFSTATGRTSRTPTGSST